MREVDEQQFTEFVRSSATRLRRTAFLVCGDWHRAEDAVQQAYVRLFQSWSRVQDRGAMERYVRTTAVRWLIDESRRPGRREHVRAVLPELPTPAPDLAAATDVRTALARMPPRQRATLVLRYYEGYDVTETAELLGCSRGRSRVRPRGG